jgi:pyrroline-5-carboxylate reductase
MIKKIAFIGAGSMAEAIISGMINSNFIQAEKIIVTNRANQERLNELQEQYQVQCTHDKEKVIKNADIIILSMKPADVKSAIDLIKEYMNSNQLIISVIAGISTDYLSTLIHKEVPVIRAMPNTSASIGFSATALSKGKNVSDQHIKMSESLFQTIGTTVIVAEEDMHTVTAISGSGPAYVYYLVEAMEKAAIEAGLDQDIATSLIAQTVLGAGEMLQHSGKSASTLRKNITSPAGTTEAGIKTLAKYDFEKVIMECVKNASNRSVELGQK